MNTRQMETEEEVKAVVTVQYEGYVSVSLFSTTAKAHKYVQEVKEYFAKKLNIKVKTINDLIDYNVTINVHHDAIVDSYEDPEEDFDF